MPSKATATRTSFRSRMRGVTLLELMAVVAIIGILAAIAVPSYRGYVMRAQRTDAMSALLRIAAAQEKFYLQNNQYADGLDDLGIPGTENGWYDVVINNTNVTRDFTVTATAASGGAQANDSHCASFSLTSTGVKTATNADCWR